MTTRDISMDGTMAVTQEVAGDAPRLHGDLAMWILIVAEMLSFGALFIVFAVVRARSPEVFAAGQRTLDLDTGALNTALLLTGSWCAVRGVDAFRAARRLAGTRWTWAAVACGLGFIVLKWQEYAHKAAQGIDIEDSDFFRFYYLLTGFHALHVVAATAVLAGIAWLAPRRHWGPDDTHAPETAAALWHMVDLLWIVLFPLVYVLR
jgi:nitric oxide reductase NorE protein